MCFKHVFEEASKTLGACISVFPGSSSARKPCQCGPPWPLSKLAITSPGAHDLEQALTLYMMCSSRSAVSLSPLVRNFATVAGITSSLARCSTRSL